MFADTVAPPAWQASLFGLDDPEPDPTFAGAERWWLDSSSWLDLVPRWLSGSDHVFAELVARIPWQSRVVPMYGRMLDEPRLTWWWRSQLSAPPLPVLDTMRVVLDERYGVPFESMGANYYRNGADSVAWHADKEQPGIAQALVAIVSVGAPRALHIRPRGGGGSLEFHLGQGDLLVMGGDCQRNWEHAVPKVAAAGPRISLVYRWGAT